MPNLVVTYTPDVEADGRLDALCRTLADILIAARDDAGQPVFPIGGVRVLAHPAAHAAVADGRPGCGFVYLNLRIARGRSPSVHRRTGEALAAAVRDHFAPLMARRHLGITLQIDEGHEVFDAKLGNLHPLYTKAS